jgi:hypothetical protein
MRSFTFQLRRQVSSVWTTKNTVLRQGEPGVEIDTNRFKIGDGKTPWTSLPYFVNENGVLVLLNEAVADLVLNGVPGTQGPKGDKGDTGSTGPQGIQGIQGVKGDTGDTGPQGIQGIKGDTGNVGPAGPANLLVLGAAEAVPGGTPVGTVIVRRP